MYTLYYSPGSCSLIIHCLLAELGAPFELKRVDFEKKEHQLFGEEGFEKMVDRVASIERTLGIYDLAQFTPRL